MKLTPINYISVQASSKLHFTLLDMLTNRPKTNFTSIKVQNSTKNVYLSAFTWEQCFSSKPYLEMSNKGTSGSTQSTKYGTRKWCTWSVHGSQCLSTSDGARRSLIRFSIRLFINLQRRHLWWRISHICFLLKL